MILKFSEFVPGALDNLPLQCYELLAIVIFYKDFTFTFLLQVLQLNSSPFAIEFIDFAIEFITLAIEFICKAIPIGSRCTGLIDCLLVYKLE